MVNYPLDLHGLDCLETHVHKFVKIFHHATLFIQQIQMDLQYNICLHTYILTDIACVQHVGSSAL